MYVITKDFSFSAAHQLNLGANHQCSRMHGHNYIVRVELSAGSLDDAHMVFDYGGLRPFGEHVAKRLDHRYLNDVLDNPTAERLAAFLWGQLQTFIPVSVASAVGVSETPTCWAWYRP